MKTLALITFLSFAVTLATVEDALARMPFQTAEEQFEQLMLKCSEKIGRFKEMERVYVKETPTANSWTPAFTKEKMNLTIRFNNNVEAQDFVAERINNVTGKQTTQFLSQCQSQASQKLGEDSVNSNRYCSYLSFNVHTELVKGNLCN